ncbi:hypothetical protein RIF29_38413 [Crotalaria pallida]|uniref:Uncharacterized protein n=1 Tax=Crotalaria pallida TaxID=3830 RepID=A0AAN9E5H3_CROPI
MPPGSDQLEAVYHPISLSRYHTISPSNRFMILISCTMGFGSIYISFLGSIIGDSGENLVKSTSILILFYNDGLDALVAVSNASYPILSLCFISDGLDALVATSNNNQQSNGFLFDGEFDEYLGDLVDCNSCGDNNQFNAATDHHGQQNQHQQQHYGVPNKTYAEDSVVAVRQHQQGQYFQLGLVFESSKAGFSFNGSISQSVNVL